MRRLVGAVLIGAALAAGGCGGNTDVNPKDLTEEQKRKVAEEDKTVADEESQGSVNKPKASGKKR